MTSLKPCLISETGAGFGEKRPKGERISQYFSNGQIEYYTLNRASVIPYRLLVSVESDDQPVCSHRDPPGCRGVQNGSCAQSVVHPRARPEGLCGRGRCRGRLSSGGARASPGSAPCRSPPPFLFFSLPLTLLYAPPTGRNRSIPGLALPFTSFETPRAALQVRDGGLVLLPPLPSRTNWTRLVPRPVLTGHVSSLRAPSPRRWAGGCRVPGGAGVGPPRDESAHPLHTACDRTDPLASA